MRDVTDTTKEEKHVLIGNIHLMSAPRYQYHTDVLDFKI